MKKQLDLGLVGNQGPLFEAGCPNCGAQIGCYCNQEIRGLSFWQPFGTLMFYNKVETRSWGTDYRGLVLICTTKTPLSKQPLDKSRHIVQDPGHIAETVKAMGFESLQPYDTRALNGFAIGIGRLEYCRLATPADYAYCVVHGGWSHMYTDVKRIQPFAIKGGQGWFTITPEMKKQIRHV